MRDKLSWVRAHSVERQAKSTEARSAEERLISPVQIEACQEEGWTACMKQEVSHAAHQQPCQHMTKIIG